MLVRADFMAIEWSGWPAAGWPSSTSDVSGAAGAPPGHREQDVSSEDVPEGLESP